MAPRTKEQFEEIRQEKKDLILSTALRLFADKGFHTTSIDRIAKEAGVAKGLMYNYFENKEALLIELFNGYLKLLDELLNPDNDDEITSEEMGCFFDKLRDSLCRNNQYWRLFSFLSLQKEVISVLISKVEKGVLLLRHQQLVQKYFQDRYENYQLEAFIFQSLIKGFTIQYVFAPSMIPEQFVNDFFDRMKKTYVIEKRDK